MTHKLPVSLESLHELNGGKVRVAANAALNTILGDVEDRGDDLKARKVVITIEVGKIAAESNDIWIDVQVKTTIPSYATGSTVARLVLDNAPGRPARWGATFAPDSPENPDQGTLYKRPPHPEAPDQDLGGD